MNTTIYLAIAKYIKRNPQINLESEDAQKNLANFITIKLKQAHQEAIAILNEEHPPMGIKGER